VNRALDVHLDGALAGTVVMSTSGALSFRYAEEHLARPDPTPLSMAMPLDRPEHRNKVVLPFLQGLLPDNAQALASMAIAFGVSAASPFALLEHVGRDVAGALQFVPAGTPSPDSQGSPTHAEPVGEAEIGRMLRDAMAEYADGRPLDRREGRFSLAGAQPKIALHALAGGGWGLPQDAIPTTHILKPVTGEMAGVDVVEQITMEAARQLDLTVAESHLAEFDGVRTFVSARYDRVLRDGVWRRLHQEDLCQALAVPPSKKYQRRDGGPGLAAVSDLLEAVPDLGDRHRAAEAFFAGFVFNAVVGGTDAHAKNYSLLLAGDRVALAPLYDLASYAPYWAGERSIELAMNVNGVYRLDAITGEDLVRAGMRLRLSRAEAQAIVLRLRAGTAAAFERARAVFEGHGPEAGAIADRVVDSVTRLPLVERPSV
jgi:serine/threonine-protein kinase HipA